MLTVRQIDKGFQGVQALRNVGFDAKPGRVLGIVGENGAGKSTLMNILGGVLQPDAGTMTLDGRPYAPPDPAAATGAGIAFIHQELNLFTNLSITDNLFIDGFPRGRLPFIRYREARAQTRSLLTLVGLEAPPDTPVEALSPGERQLVEIARALRAKARLILFDEPTTSLTSRETRRLFGLIDRLRSEGTAVLYISHVLGDVLALADDLLVLRDGEVVASGERAAFTVDRLIAAMVGRDLDHLFPERAAPAPEGPAEAPALEVTGLSQPGVVHDIAFTLRKGEVLGVFGLMGSGRTELARILFGLDPAARGEVRIDGTPCEGLTPRERIGRGMAFITEDRRGEGLLLDASVQENVGLAALDRFSTPRFALIDRRRLREAVEATADSLRIKGGRDRQPVRTLSGGNQQKVVIGKWLLAAPSVLIMDEPTRGIDVGARYEVYTIVRDLAARGVGVLCISSEIEELIGLCDRILVLHRGEIRGRFDREAFEPEPILRAAFGEGDGP